MVRLPFASIITTLIPRISSAQSTIVNWDLNYISFNTDFGIGSTDEVVINYEVGKDRMYNVDIFNNHCINGITGTTITTNLIRTPMNDFHDSLSVLLDMDKTTIATSNIWSPFTSKLEFCIRVQLMSSSGIVVKEDERIIDIDFDFSIGFESTVPMSTPSLPQRSSGSTTVTGYLEICKCDSIQSFNCNTNPLQIGDELHICIKSLSPDIEIDFVDNIIIAQGEKELILIEANSIQDPNLITMEESNEDNRGVGIASVVPHMFWPQTGASSMVVTGVVWLKLAGSRRLVTVASNDLESNTGAHDATRRLRKDSFAVEPKDDTDKSSFKLTIGLQRGFQPQALQISGTTKPSTIIQVAMFGVVAAFALYE